MMMILIAIQQNSCDLLFEMIEHRYTTHNTQSTALHITYHAEAVCVKHILESSNYAVFALVR